jgi:cytochrome P450
LTSPVVAAVRTVKPLPREEMTWIRSYVEGSEIFKSADFFSPLHYRNSYPVVGESIQSLFGDAHTARRRTELSVVARDGLMHYEFDVLMPIVRAGLVRSDDGSDRTVDLLELMKTAVIKVAASAIGLDGVETDADVDLLTEIGDKVSNGTQVEWSLVSVEGVIAEALDARQRFIDAFYADSKARREALIAGYQAGEIPESDLPSDLITVLLKKKSGQLWDDEDLLVREMLFWLSASTATSIHASAHVFMEILTWLAGHPEDRPLFDDLSFLQSAVGEAVRLHPPIPAQLRCALREVRLSTGRVIAEGEQIALDLNGIDRDPAFFGKNADRFDPHRDGPATLHRYGVSFGQGVHACLGRRLAIGAGNGRVEEGERAPAGLIVRLMQALLAADARLDPDDPPRLRETSSQDRWDVFPVVIPGRPASAGGCPVHKG